MKFINTFIALLATTSTLANSFLGKRIATTGGLQNCINSINKAGCPLSDYIDKEGRNVEKMCAIFNNNACQGIFRKGVHNHPDCGNVSEDLIREYEQKIDRSMRRLQKTCRSHKKEKNKEATNEASTSNNSNDFKNESNGKSHNSNNNDNTTTTSTATTTTVSTSTSITSTSTTSTSTTSTTIISDASSTISEVSNAVASATPSNVKGEIANSGSMGQFSVNVLISSIGLVFYFLL
ncbi:hypothetical protein U3516DRAFT_551739 [Neocallimastix sp. 'constans']|jgi:hypothetical protein